jgi:polysaccharide export outer membrane protein
MRPIVTATALLVAAAGAAWGQKLAAAPESGANLPFRRIGPNDLLAIAVYGAPELSRSIRVAGDGTIRLPMLIGKIEARGAMPAELEGRIAGALTEERILVDPVVTVTISEYGSRPVSVVGAVRRPSTFPVSEKITLLDALARAEGLSPEAGGEILVTRPGREAGANARVERVEVRELIEAANPAANLPLEGGEEVRVPESGRIFVVGNVKRPGAFRVGDASAFTVLQALALSEGLAPFAAKEAFIFRPSDSGPRKELAVALRKILDRKAPDVPLEVGDILYIPDNRRARTTSQAIERALSFAAGTASGALILGVNR